MKITNVEFYEDDRFQTTRYRYDSITSGGAARSLLEEFAASGADISNISVWYAVEDYYSYAPAEANSMEEFRAIAPSVHWKHVESITFHGVQDEKLFHGEIVALDSGGYFKQSFPKR